MLKALNPEERVFRNAFRERALAADYVGQGRLIRPLEHMAKIRQSKFVSR